MEIPSSAKKPKIFATKGGEECHGQVEVVVVGSLNTDLVAYTPTLPGRGETLLGTSFETGFGGKGANQAVMASRMGAKVGFIGALGSDSFGDSYMVHLESEGIDCRHVARVEGSTGVAQICVDREGQNFIVVVPGANGRVDAAAVGAAAPLLAGAWVVVCQGEIPTEGTLAALQLGKQQGLITILNTAPADPNLPEEIFGFIDLLCLNEPELEVISGCDTSSLDQIKKAALDIIAKGPQHIVVTMGEKGALIVSQNEDSFVEAQKDLA